MDSFGPFESRDITGLSPGLNVIVGPDQEYLNAFRDFFRRVLFGFDVDASNHSGSLSAPCGGLLEIVHSDGSPLTIERYLRGLGGDAGQVTVSRAGELRPEFDDLFGPALIDVNSWLNCFDISPGTIDHDANELLKLTFSLLAGTDGPDPGEVQAFFDNEADSIARAMTAVQTARHVAYERYRRAGEEFDSYATLHGQRADLDRQINDADIELAVVRARFHRIEALEESRPAWSRMHELQTAMSGMPRFAYLPPEPLAYLTDLRDRERDLQSEIDRGDAEDSPRVAELDELTSSPASKYPTDEARQLLAHRYDYAEAIRELPALSVRLEESERGLEEGLARLGRGWDDAKLDTVEDSPALRDRLEKLEADITSQRIGGAGNTQRAEETRERLESAHSQAGEAKQRLEALGEPPDITIESATERLDTITRARAEMVERTEAQRTLDESLARAVDARPRRSISAGRLIPLIQLGMSGGLAVVGIIVWLLAMMAGDSAATRTGLVVGITGVIGILMSIAILWVQKRHSAAQYTASEVLHKLALRSAEELEKEIETNRVQLAYVKECLHSSLTELDLTRDLPLAQLDLEKERVTREMDRLHTIDEVTAAIKAAGEVVDSAAWNAEGADETVGDAKNQLTAMENDWEDILTSLGLPDDLAMNAVRETLDLIAELRRVRTDIRELQIRVPAMKMVIVEVEVGLSELAETAGLPEFAAHKAGPVLEQLKEGREDIVRKQDRVGRLRRDGETWATRRTAVDREIEEARRERRELLDLVGAADEAAFREISSREEERRRLSAELDEIRRTSHHLTGPSGREIEVELQDAGPEALAVERDALMSRISRLEELQKRLEARARELDERMEALSGPPSTLDHRIEMYQLDEQRADLARKQVTLQTARRFISDAVTEYSSAGQQGRLRLTGEYLKRLSGGALIEVRTAATDRDTMFGGFEVVSLNGHAERVDTLGSDLLRQLYLSSKLAIVHERAEAGEPVPVLIHDLGAMLGREHARHFATAAEELAHHTQVFLLTDHPGTVERAREAAVSAAPRVFDLGLQGRQIRLSA